MVRANWEGLILEDFFVCHIVLGCEEVLDGVAGATFGIGRLNDGEVREHLRFFVDGLVIGAQE